MKIYRDIISGDEMFSDIYPISLSESGMMYIVKGKLVTRKTDDIDDSAIGGNPSAEDPQESSLTSSISGVDIILNHKLQEISFNKKQYKDYLKEYAKAIKAKLKDDKIRCDAFINGLPKEMPTLLPKLNNCQFFTGESMNFDSMVALLDYDEDEKPYMMFFKDGLIEEKC